MTRHDSYWLGYRHGKALAEHQPNENHEPALRFQVDAATAPTNPHRAFALGELRGYREARHAD
jgi:hypothetical protein